MALSKFDEFRSNPEKVNKMRLVLEDPILKEWLAVMKESGPENREVISPDITPTMSAIVVGLTRGYARYHNDFKLGGEHLVPRGTDSAEISLEPEE
jgi:hypothetical protein